MALALLSVRGYGVEAEEALNKRYRQFLILKGTGLNTDITHDYGATGGTFWTAVGGTEPGTTALLALKDIIKRGEIFLDAQGTAIAGKQRTDASRTIITKLDSAATAGGAATETLTVTGLLTTDVILAVTPFQKAGTSANTPVIDYGDATGNCTTNGQLPVELLGNPGVGALYRVALSRTSTTPEAGTYILTMNGTSLIVPDLLFLSGDAPTAWAICLSWVLKDGHAPVEVYKAA